MWPAPSPGPVSTGCPRGPAPPAVFGGRGGWAGGRAGTPSLAPPASATARQVVAPRPGSPPAAAGGAQTGPISLGSATAEQLDQVEGIGPVTAQKIIEFRDQHGGLSSIDQLDEVDGIGPSTMQTLRAGLQP